MNEKKNGSLAFQYLILFLARSTSTHTSAILFVLLLYSCSSCSLAIMLMSASLNGLRIIIFHFYYRFSFSFVVFVSVFLVCCSFRFLFVCLFDCLFYANSILIQLQSHWPHRVGQVDVNFLGSWRRQTSEKDRQRTFHYSRCLINIWKVNTDSWLRDFSSSLWRKHIFE